MIASSIITHSLSFQFKRNVVRWLKACSMLSVDFSHGMVDLVKTDSIVTLYQLNLQEFNPITLTHSNEIFVGAKSKTDEFPFRS